MRRFLFGAVWILPTLTPMFAAAPFRVAADSPVRIEYGGPADAEVVRFAARQLGEYAQRLVGRSTAWPVAPSSRRTGGYRIRLALRGAALPVETEIPANSAADEYAIQAASGGLTIAASNANTLLTAVYVFLEEQGCRWLYPGASGEFVPAGRALETPAGTRRSRAGFPLRGIHPVENLQRYSEQDVRDTLDWMAKNRFNRLVFIYNYGWNRLGPVLREESRKRGIRLVAYLWSFELFLPLELGKSHPEYFAFLDGRRRVDYNVKRCASSPAAIQTYVRNGLDFFRRNPEIAEWIVIPNDGYHWCQCDACQRMKPKDQWAEFFVPLAEAVAQKLPQLRLQNFVYVRRYALPERVEAYRSPALSHFFDVFPRNKWFPLRASEANNVDRGEASVDERAAQVSKNRYLADRLSEWRKAAPGPLWVFEDLMLHATYSIPIPNLTVLAADLRAASIEHLDGYLFEAYGQGWTSYAADLWAMGRLCWDSAQDAAELERSFYRLLLGDQAGPIIRFQERFRTVYLPPVRKCGESLYWMHCVPAAVPEFQTALDAVDASRLNGNGQVWLANQKQVAHFLSETLRRGGKDVAPWRAFSTRRPADVLALCELALSSSAAMDGPFIAYAELARLFSEQFGTGSLGFHPLLPDDFDPRVRDLFSRQKLWDTLAVWEASGKFPVEAAHPDRSLDELLRLAIGNARRHWGIDVR